MQTEDSILTQVNAAIDRLKNQRGDTSEWTIVLSPEYYARFCDECTRYMSNGGPATGVALYRGMPVVGDKGVTGVQLQKREAYKNLGVSAVTLDENELYLLFSLLNDRMVQAAKVGLPDDHDSSVFRESLYNKLVPFVHKGKITLSLPEQVRIEEGKYAYRK